MEIFEEKSQAVKGPIVEILCLNGQIKRNEEDIPEASLYGVVCDQYGDFSAGRFVPGANNDYVTMELITEEWSG